MASDGTATGSATAGKKAGSLSDRELKVIAIAWQCLQGDPKIDYKKFWQPAGYKNLASARSAWNVLQKKLDAFAAGIVFPASPAGDDGPSTPASATAATAAPRGLAGPAVTPTPKKRAPRKRKSDAAATDADADNDGEDDNTLNEGTPGSATKKRKSATPRAKKIAPVPAAGPAEGSIHADADTNDQVDAGAAKEKDQGQGDVAESSISQISVLLDEEN